MTTQTKQTHTPGLDTLPGYVINGACYTHVQNADGRAKSMAAPGVYRAMLPLSVHGGKQTRRNTKPKSNAGLQSVSLVIPAIWLGGTGQSEPITRISPGTKTNSENSGFFPGRSHLRNCAEYGSETQGRAAIAECLGSSPDLIRAPRPGLTMFCRAQKAESMKPLTLSLAVLPAMQPKATAKAKGSQ